ncbi:uncharacterized protein LOC135677938 [Musa acuminata AAA Group]|uniref:uncharacterized protein LOC135677938 n=1 Tax=Musa acuminata AAA Group TaxID=214697 RepID=UPI0031D42E4C
MALCTSNQKDYAAKPHPLYLRDIQFDCNWEDVTRPICLDFPHNGVLLWWSSYEKGMSTFHLWKHDQLNTPTPTLQKYNPARQLDQENFQQPSQIIDVLRTTHSEVPHGVALGEYVIEHGDADVRDEHEGFPRSRGNWWDSCIFFKGLHRGSRNWHRSRESGRNRVTVQILMVQI